MKKILSIILLILAFPALASCSAEDDGTGAPTSDGANSFSMKAEVTSLGEKIEVNVTEAEYASGIYWIITSENTEFLDKSGKKISKEDIKVGDTVYITYNGQIMMSYPPQVAALSIKKAK